ncbi:predicted protein [Naegleria gruberi]|uniref:Predicted protein n=1 Tax=Naegleria gruberi TaxID=5762 RepID=D2VS52_NAEGR|nr:uncharacterized protein NAEGRDRAFT_51825 [Naegleria gruberi]EFC40365.1 predicted protein [Naegleria gruberi]|eukprot:XP_002673109.1 predicted protein [Naegleria gruberi strain NEG-M]
MISSEQHNNNPNNSPTDTIAHSNNLNNYSNTLENMQQPNDASTSPIKHNPKPFLNNDLSPSHNNHHQHVPPSQSQNIEFSSTNNHFIASGDDEQHVSSSHDQNQQHQPLLVSSSPLPSPTFTNTMNNINTTANTTIHSPTQGGAASFFKRLLSNLTPNLSRQNHLQLSEKNNQHGVSGSRSNGGSGNMNGGNVPAGTNCINHQELDLDGLSVKSVESTPSVDLSSNNTSGGNLNNLAVGASNINHNHQQQQQIHNNNNGNNTRAIMDIFPKSRQEEEPSMDNIISRKLAQKKKNSVKPVDINAFTDNNNEKEKVLTQNTVFKNTPMQTLTPSALLSGKVSMDLFANVEDEKKKPKKKRQETGIKNVETTVKTRNKTYLKKMTFMTSLSTSGDQHPTSSNSTKKGQQKEQAPFENDLLFNDLQVFKNQVFKRYCKILEQPIFCKAFNYEVLGPREFLTNPYVLPQLIEESPAVSTVGTSSPKKEEQNPFLFDEKFVKEFKWRRRKTETQSNSVPNVPTVDIVCEDGATLSCYFEMVGQNEQPSTSTKQDDSSSTTSKKTLLLFHDGCEEAFEYFFQPSLRKFKDFIISMGLQIFIFEYRGFGYSTCAKGEDERTSLHRFLETDYKLVHHLFTTRLKIPMSQVVVYGKGFLGSTCAIHFVSNFPTVSGLCLESPCFDVLKVVLGNLPENVLSYISSQGAEQGIVRPEDETIRFEFTKYNFGVEKYYRMPYPKNKKIMSTKQQNARPKTTIVCKVGDERYYNLKEVKNCITHHFDVYNKLSCFPGKLLILFQQGNELVPYCDVENFFKCIKTGEKNMYLLSSNEISTMTSANDDPFNLFERKFFTCVRAIHKFMESVSHSFPDNFNQFLEKLFQLEQRLLEDQANQTSELSDLAASGSYVDTYESYGGRGRRNPYLPICGGCGHCRACVDQSMIENEGTDNTDHDCDSEASSEEE